MHTFSRPSTARRNLIGAEIVDKGIALQEKYGTRYSAEFLKNQKINIDVVLRVLLRPLERRLSTPRARTFHHGI